jgi:hypothetical protein
MLKMRKRQKKKRETEGEVDMWKDWRQCARKENRKSISRHVPDTQDTIYSTLYTSSSGD